MPNTGMSKPNRAIDGTVCMIPASQSIGVCAQSKTLMNVPKATPIGSAIIIVMRVILMCCKTNFNNCDEFDPKKSKYSPITTVGRTQWVVTVAGDIIRSSRLMRDSRWPRLVRPPRQ